MDKLIDLYIEKGLVTRKATRFYVTLKNEPDPVILGMGKEKSEATLLRLVDSGKVPDIRIEPSQPLVTSEEITEPSEQQSGTSEEIPATQMTPSEEKELSNPFKTESELEENEDLMIEEMLANVGDISSETQSDELDIYINDIEVRNSNHPEVKKCKFVFRWRSKPTVVRSGDKIKEWVIVSKKMISANPRTGKPWLTVRRDDTPNDDFYTNAEYVLCYASKSQFVDKKNREVVKNTMRVKKMEDERKAFARQQAEISRTPGGHEKVAAAYSGDNAVSRGQTMEHLQYNKGMSYEEAQQFVDSIGDPEAQIEAAKKITNQGNDRKSRGVSIRDI